MLAWLDSETFSPFTHCSLRGQKLCVEKAVGVERIDKASTMYTLLPVYISYSSVSYVVATEAVSVVGAFVSRFEAAIASAGKPRHDWTWRRQAQWRWWRRRCTVGPNCKSPPKMRLKKNSWYRWIILVPATVWQILNVNRKRKLCEFAETCMEKLVKSPWANLCFGGFSTFWTTVRRCAAAAWHY